MGVGIDDSDVGLVFNIDIQMAVTIGYCLLRRSAEIDRARHRAIHCVEDRRVGRAVSQTRSGN
jgi:hypothetical protein